MCLTDNDVCLSNLCAHFKKIFIIPFVLFSHVLFVIKKQMWEGNKISHKKSSSKYISQDLKVQIFGKEKKVYTHFKFFLIWCRLSHKKP